MVEKSKKELKEEEKKKALAKAKKAAAAKKAVKSTKKPTKKVAKKAIKKVKKVKKAKKLVKKVKKIVKKEVILKDENGEYTAAGWAAQAIVGAKVADKKFVKLPLIKKWLKENSTVVQESGGTFWLNKHLLEGIAKLVKGKLVGQVGWGFSIRKQGEEKILGKVFPKAEKGKKPKAAASSSSSSTKSSAKDAKKKAK